MPDDNTCPDCGVTVGERHREGCDVALCKACGAQELQCGAHDVEMTAWTGTWPGQVEVAEFGLADLNELAAMHAEGEVVWDPAAERLVKGPDSFQRIVRLLAASAPIDVGDLPADTILCRGCAGFDLDGRLVHQPGCAVLRAQRLIR